MMQLESKLKLPASQRNALSSFDVLDYNTTDDPSNNPFRMPKETDTWKLLEEEKMKQRLTKKEMFKKPLHLKTTSAYRLRTTTSHILNTIPPAKLPKEPPLSPTSVIRNDPEFLRALATGEKLRNMENISSFLSTKREMFLIQYLIGVKKDEMLRMENKETNEEKKINLAEKLLEDDAIKFDMFLKQNDREAVEASKRAEAEAKLKLDKVAEIKKIHVQIASIKSDITKLDDIFAERKMYRQFLFYLSPQDWIDQEVQKLELRKARSSSVKTLPPIFPTMKRESTVTSPSGKSRDTGSKGARVSVIGYTEGYSTATITEMPRRRQRFSRRTMSKKSDIGFLSDLEGDGSSGGSISISTEDSILLSPSASRFYEEDEEDEGKLPLYFTNPQQLRDIFVDLEEMNLMMIQKNQETEEALEEVQAAFEKNKLHLDSEVKVLKSQIQLLTHLVKREEERANNFEIKCKLFSFGEFNEDMQETMLNELNARVESVYESVIGPNDANLSTLQMMTSIENKLEDLLELVDQYPMSRVASAAKLRDRQRRIQQRQQKLKEQQIIQKDMLKRTIEKALAAPKKSVGRRLIFRSAPPQPKQVIDKRKWRSREEDEYNYFFM